MAKRAVFKVSLRRVPQNEPQRYSQSRSYSQMFRSRRRRPLLGGRKCGNAADYGRTQRIRNALPGMAAGEGGPGSPRPSTKTTAVSPTAERWTACPPAVSIRLRPCARRHDPERAVFLQPCRAFVAQQCAADFSGIVAQADADDLETLGMLVAAEAARRPIRQFTNRNCCESRCAGRRPHGCCSGQR